MLGIILAFFAALMFGLCTVIQKYCLKGIKKLYIKDILRNRVWMISILVGLTGIFLYLAALHFAPISVVQPMLSISITIPVLVGWLMFKESLRSRWFHIMLIIVGVFLLSL